MTTAASSSTGLILPLIPCPLCNVQVNRCVSKKGNVYYRCPRNHLNDETCDKYWFEDEYVSYLQKQHPELLESTSSDVHAKVKAVQGLQETDELKLMAMEMRLMAIDLKTEMKDLKDELRKAKANFWWDNTTVVLFLCMVVAFVVAICWKK